MNMFIDLSKLFSAFSLSVLFILNISSLQAAAFSADDEEMKLLYMYFNEDQLVVSPTRTLKKLSETAENIEVITAKEIERMNAHTVAEAIERTTGVFASFYGHDFGSDTSVHIQGSTNRHVLVLVDGIPWNTLVEGTANLSSIPVGIIKRIEIIKGPASSSWGSSLGGVINVITKDAVKNAGVEGSVSVSLGERDTMDLRAEISGSSRPVSYYLYAGRQGSDGLRKDRWFDNDTFYAKLKVPFSSDTEFLITAGYSEPHINDGETISMDIYGSSHTRDFFTTASLTTELSEALTFDSSFYFYKHKFVQDVDEIGTGYWGGSPGEMFKDTVSSEKNNGASAKLIYTDREHTALLGTDYSYGNNDFTTYAGSAYVFWYSAPPVTSSHTGITRWAVFANDTITLGRFSVTPGIRHDYSSISGNFLSPSIGASYRASENTILRASIAKGFNEPHLGASAAGGLFLDPNPDLIHEEVWSYQAGVDTWALEYLRVKINLFHHDIENDLVKEKYVGPPPTNNDRYFNKEKSKRDGLELDLETAPVHNISVRAGYAFVHKRTYYDEATSEDTYICNLALRYDDLRSLFAELAGHYIWWDMDAANMPEYDTFIWDMNLNKKLGRVKDIRSDFFLTVHNIFKGSQYSYYEKKNPSRWFEAGVKFTF